MVFSLKIYENWIWNGLKKTLSMSILELRCIKVLIEHVSNHFRKNTLHGVKGGLRWVRIISCETFLMFFISMMFVIETLKDFLIIYMNNFSCRV